MHIGSVLNARQESSSRWCGAIGNVTSVKVAEGKIEPSQSLEDKLVLTRQK